MSVSIIIKKALSYPLNVSINICNYIRYRKRKEYIILMYHRIKEKNDTDGFYQEGMYVDPNTFKGQINYLKDKFQIISLENLFSGRSIDIGSSNDKVLCALTFDDGWHDFYENAYPALKYYDVCATVFLPTDYIGTNRIFWTDRLACILQRKRGNRQNNQLSASNNDSFIKRIENMNGPINFRLEKAVEELKSLPMEDIEQILDALTEKSKNSPITVGRSFLSWDEVKEMHGSGIVSFGSHTKSHRILTTVTEDVIREELVQSKNTLLSEGVVTPSFIPFAYPNGNYTEGIAQIVQETGYSIAVTTERGWNRHDVDREGRYLLKRIGIHQDIASTNSMLGCRIYGIY